MADDPEPDPSAPAAVADAGEEEDAVVGSAALRPLFLGNLQLDCAPDDVKNLFEAPFVPPPAEGADDEAADERPAPIAVDRVDPKRGYCFVYLKDAEGEADKARIEAFVKAMQGVAVPRVSSALRIEFARGDGRVKRKEDARRHHIAPSDTLFVVNFHEATTRREDLEMLFAPYGELLRIDMKRNFAFVQFRSVEEATKARVATDGGKLDQSVLTVEFVAAKSGEERRRGGGGGDYGGRDRRGGGNDRDRRGGPPRGGPRYDGRDRYYDDRYERRSRSPPRYRDDHRRPRSRSRSPRYNDRDRYGRGGGRSPPRYDDRDYRRPRSPPGGGGYRSRSPEGGYRPRSRSPDPGYRGRSPPDDRDRGGYDRPFERGYRS